MPSPVLWLLTLSGESVSGAFYNFAVLQSHHVCIARTHLLVLDTMHHLAVAVSSHLQPWSAYYTHVMFSFTTFI